MTKSLLVAATAVSGIMFAAPAAAQTAPSGPRVEVQVGYDKETYNLDTTDDYGRSGLYTGVGVGYDVPVGPVAIGIDLEAGKSSVGDDFFYTEDGVDNIASIENERDLYAGARLTFGVGPADLYVKGGYSTIRTVIDVESDDGDTITREIIEDDDEGYRLGAGGRFYFGRNLYAGAEYRYSEYGNDNLDKHQVVGTLGVSF